MYYKTRFLREDGADTGGGGLANLVNSLSNPPADPPPGDPPKPVTDPVEVARLQQEQDTLKTEAFEADGTTLKPGYKKTDTGVLSKDPNYKPADEPVEGTDENGEPIAGYKKDDTGKIVVDPDYKAPELTDEEQSAQFWDEVNAITGDNIEIEYPEGIDPLTPQGIAHYTSVIREDAALAFEEYLQQNDPRSYAYMVHRKGGGTDEEFFADQKGFVLPAKEEFDASADMQTAVYKFDLRSKGLDEDSIDSLVKKAITDNQLKAKADAAYKTIDDGQKAQLESITKSDTERKAINDKVIGAMLTKVDKVIAEEMGFVVSEADKPLFKKFVIDNLRYDEGTGTFSVVQKLGDDLNSIVESLFFQHKKGNLKTLIAKKAKTETAQGLRLKLKGSSAQPGGGKSSVKSDETFIPLSEMKVNSN